MNLRLHIAPIIRNIALAAGCLLLSYTSVAQDSQFTQFYAAPTYLNPAFAGTSIQSRLSANYRNQWPAIPGAWVSYNFAFDHYEPTINSGFGLIATHERAGAGALRSNTIGVQYAYELRVGRETYFRPALQFGYSNRNINFSDLTFGDQLIRNNDPLTLEENVFEPINFFDIAAGGLLYNPNYWLGVSVHHLNEPNESLYPETVALVPRKLSMHGGIRLKAGRNRMYRRSGKELLLAFNYRQQENFSQLDLGAYIELEPIVIGVWYRGLPGLKSNGYGYLNHDAIALMAGYGTPNFRIGYSYDITISQLGLGASAGAHEISIVYEWANKRNAKLGKRRIVPCAKF